MRSQHATRFTGPTCSLAITNCEAHALPWLDDHRTAEGPADRACDAVESGIEDGSSLLHSPIQLLGESPLALVPGLDALVALGEARAACR